MKAEIISVQEVDNTLEVVYRTKSNAVYTTAIETAPVPDRVWKVIYGVVDGEIKVIGTVAGKHIPSKTIPETFEFMEGK